MSSMSESDHLSIILVVPPSEINASTCLLEEVSGREFLVMASSRNLKIHRLDSARDSVFNLELDGQITSLIPLRDRSALFVTYQERGSHKFGIFSGVPSLSETYVPSSPFVQGYGEPVDRPVFSNECEGLIVYQFQIGSIHVVSGLEGVEPQTSVFHLTRHASILPMRSMVLVPRGVDHYALIAIAGDDDKNTEIRAYNLHIEGKKVSIERVSNLPPNLAKASENIKPYKLYYDYQFSRTLTLIGGDSKSFAAVQILSVEEIVNSIAPARDVIHCQPFPLAELTGTSNGLLVCSAFGELYGIDIRMNKVSFLSDAVPGAISGVSCMTWCESEKKLFIGSPHADSYLVDPSDVAKTAVPVTTCTAPVLGISCSPFERVITTVSGAGFSASLNRIMTAGVSAGSPLVSFGKTISFVCNKIFLALNDSLLVVSSPVHSCALTVSVSGDLLKLTENATLTLPPNIQGVYDTGTAGCLCVTENGVFVLTQSGSVKRTWTSPDNKTIVSSSYCAESKVLALAVGDAVHLLTDSGSQVRKIQDIKEISAISFWKGTLAVGTWTSQIFIVSGDSIKSFQLSSVPRSIVIGPLPDSLSGPRSKESLACFAGLSDGSLSSILLESSVQSSRTIGILPVVLKFMFVGPDSRRVILASGDRPCIISVEGGEVVCTELVDSSRGTIAAMHDIHITSGLLFCTDSARNLEIFMSHPTILRANEYHVQRVSLTNGDPECIPVGVQVMGSVIATAVSSGEADSIGFYDSFQLTQLGSFALPKEDKIVAISAFRNGLLVGSAVVDPTKPSDEPTEGRIRYLTCDDGTTWIESVCHSLLRGDGGFAGAVYGIAVLDSDFVAAIAVRTLYILKLSGPQFLHVASAETGFLAVSIAAETTEEGFKIVVGDVSKSCSVFAFQREEFALFLTARDLIPASAMAADFVGSKHVVLGDDFGNVYAMESVEPSLRRLERVSGVNLSQSCVTAMTRMSPDSLLIGTRNGSLSLLTLSDKDAQQYKRNDSSGIFMEDVFEPLRGDNPSVSHRIVN